MSAVQFKGYLDDVFVTMYYQGSQWEHETNQTEAFDGTLSVFHSTAGDAGFSSMPPVVAVSFTGLDIILYGTLAKGVTANYTINSTGPHPMVFSNSTIGKPGVEMWSLTGLTDASHDLQINPIAGDLTIDYFTYTPTNSTPSPGVPFIFDDQHPAVMYSKGWVNNTDEQYPRGIPYLGTTTGTNTVGSSMHLNFNGRYVAVYGALQQVPGILNVSFAVDNAAPTVYTAWNGTQTNTSAWFIGSRMFNVSVPDGAHTLHVSLQGATGSQMLWLDAVVTQAGLETTLSNAVGGSGSGSKSGLSGGAIGGIAAGASVFVAIVLFFLLRYLSRRKKPSPDPTPMEEAPAMPTTPVYMSAPPLPELLTAGPLPTTNARAGLSLHETLNIVLNRQQGGQTLPLQQQTNWDTDDIDKPSDAAL